MDELKPTLSVNEIIQSMELLPIAAVVFEENQKIKYVNRAAQQFISKHPQFFINNKVASFIEEVKRLKKERIILFNKIIHFILITLNQ